MKKINQLAFALIIIFAFSTTSFTQDIADLGLMAMVDLEMMEEHNTRFDTKTKNEISEEERIAKAKAYDLYVSKEFGSYLNPYNGNLYIINNPKNSYNRAQLMKQGLNEKVFSIDIDQSTKRINIEDYDSGEYILILSNDRGDMKVENFIII